MTEAVWLACDEAEPMLEFLRYRPAHRKFRLFAVACCRRLWEVFTDQRSRATVDEAERFSDGMTTAEELERLRLVAHTVTIEMFGRWPPDPYARSVCAAADVASPSACGAALAVSYEASTRPCADPGWPRSEFLAQAELLHCIFGNPFRPVTFSPEWRTYTSVSLASQMYEARDFSAMPILADALQDAGCDSTYVLDHCRGPGPHVRGCWVADLVLGKE